jgi:copper(I)-binding protein
MAAAPDPSPCLRAADTTLYGVPRQEEEVAVSRSTVRSASPLARRAVLLVVAGAGAAALLAGCGAGQITQTSTKTASVPGLNKDVGDIAIRNAVVTPPPDDTWEAGSDAPLDMRLINLGLEPETLIGATSESAASVEIRPGSAAAPTAAASPGVAPVTCASPLASVSPGSSGSPSESPSPSEPATPSAPASVTPSAPAGATPSGSAPPSGAATPEPTAPAGPQSIVIPPACLVAVGPTAPQQLVLAGLKEEFLVGNVITVTLQFERAGKVTLGMPIVPPPTPLSRSPLPLEEEHAAE